MSTINDRLANNTAALSALTEAATANQGRIGTKQVNLSSLVPGAVPVYNPNTDTFEVQSPTNFLGTLGLSGVQFASFATAPNGSTPVWNSETNQFEPESPRGGSAPGGGGDLNIAQTSPPRRQCVLAGSADVIGTGLANFIVAGTGLEVIVDATPTPVTLAYAAGIDQTTGGAVDYVSTLTVDSPITPLTSSSLCYLYAELDPATGEQTYGHTTVRPGYGYAFPSNPASGDHFYLITLGEMYEYDGSSWQSRIRLFIGEAQTDATSVTSVISYSLGGTVLAVFDRVSWETVVVNIGAPFTVRSIVVSEGGQQHDEVMVEGQGGSVETRISYSAADDQFTRSYNVMRHTTGSLNKAFYRYELLIDRLF